MATTAQQSPFREFLGKLEAQDPNAASIVRTSFTSGDPEFFTQLGKVVQQHENIIPEGHNYDSLRAAAQEEFQNANPSLSQIPEQPATPQPGFSLNFGSSNGHNSGSGGANVAFGEIGQHIRGIQEEKLKQEFETLLSNSDPDKLMDEVGQFFDKNFDAQKLLSEQYQTLRERIDALAFSGEGDKKQTIKDLLDQQEKDHLKQLQDPYRGIINQSARQKIDERRRNEARQEAEIRRRIQASQFKKDKERALRELLKHKLEVSQREVGFVSPPVIPEKLRKEKGYKFTYSTGQLYDMSDELGRIFSMLGKRGYTDEEETTIITPYTTNVGSPQQEITPVSNEPTFGNPENAAGNGMNPRMRNPLNRLLQRRKGKNLAKKLEDQVEKEIKKGAMTLTKRAALWALGALGELLLDILPYLLIVLAVVAIIVAIVIWISGQGGTSKLPPTCSPSTDCLTKLKSYGINLSGDLSENGDPNGKAAYVYQTIELLTQSPSQFGKLLGLPDNQVNIIIPASGCYGHAEYSTVKVWWCGDNALSQFMLAHELGHVLAFRNHDLYMKFQDSMNWKTNSLNTFNCRYDYGYENGPYPGECWADMIGEYLVYKQWRDAVRDRRGGGLIPSGPSNYPNFPQEGNPSGYYYNFAQQYIFGGLQY